MRMLRSLWKRFAALIARPDEEDLIAELESHVAMHTEDGIHAGLDPAEARRQALIRLGGVEQTRQAYRERRGLPWLESLARDFAYSVRTLSKHRGITAIAVLSIGLGIGANATIFSMVSRFVLRPAPVGDPSTLISLQTRHDGNICCDQFSWPLFTDVRDQARSFAGVAAYYQLIPASIGGNGEPERLMGQAVTTNFFDVTQLRMTLGRGFLSGEDNLPLIVLGGDLWQRRFASDPLIVGKTIQLSGRSYTVVGVAPPAFHSVDQILYTQFWVPMGNVNQLVPSLPDKTSRNSHWLAVVGRLKPGVTRAQAEIELDTIAKRLASMYLGIERTNGFVSQRAGSLPPQQKDAVLAFLAALLVVVLLVLAIACANVANLLFAQAASRQRDMAVRLALGATRGRLRRQMLMESLLLGLGGGTVGVLLSVWTTRALSALRLPVPVPFDLSINVDWPVLLYCFAVSVISGLLLGVAPAWAASRPLVANALRGEDALIRAGRSLSLRNLLVTGQVAMSMILLCLTGLFLRSLESAANIDIGFRPQHLYILSVDPRVNGYTPERTVQFLEELRRRVAALPGVASAVCTDVAPLSMGNSSGSFRMDDRSNSDKSEYIADLTMATPGYFDTMGIPRIAGRDFGDETATGPKTAIVNRAFVNQVMGGANPIGKHVTGAGVHYEIIGVVGNAKSRTLGEELRPVLYRPLAQSVAGDPSFLGYTLVVRTVGSPNGIAQAVRQQIYALDPAMAIFNDATMEEHVRAAFFLPHLAAMLFGTFGFIGLVLATVGLYGVMSYAVSRRTREIGIRMAMGAQPGTVERLILRQGMVLTLIAVALGWPAAWMLSRLAASFLYGIQPHDAFTFAVVPPILLAIALVACWIPARRAASIDPMKALRTE